MSIDLLRRSVISSTTGRIELEKIPFWPISWRDDSGVLKVRFNPGYLVDYQKRGGSKITSNLQNVYRPDNIETTFRLENGNMFFLNIKTSGNESAPITLSIEQVSETPNSISDWHFGSINVESVGYQSNTSDGGFRIPMCMFDSSTGILKEIVLRENIHYQKFHMENVGGGPGRVLKTIGESSGSFGSNPPTQLRSILGESPIVVTETENEIVISYDDGSDSDGSGTDGGGGGTGENPKSAIVPYGDKYVGMWCNEGDTPYFHEIISVNMKGDKKRLININPILISICDPKSLMITSVAQENSSASLSTSLINKQTKLLIKNKSWFKPANKVNITITGIRKGFANHKYKTFNIDTYNANNYFYSLSHNPKIKPVVKKIDENSVEHMDIQE